MTSSDCSFATDTNSLDRILSWQSFRSYSRLFKVSRFVCLTGSRRYACYCVEITSAIILAFFSFVAQVNIPLLVRSFAESLYDQLNDQNYHTKFNEIQYHSLAVLLTLTEGPSRAP